MDVVDRMGHTVSGFIGGALIARLLQDAKPECIFLTVVALIVATGLFFTALSKG